MKPLPGRQAGLLQPIVPDGVLASHWGADFIGPLSKGTGRINYVLIAVDYTKILVVVQTAQTAEWENCAVSQRIHHPAVWMDETAHY